tara:strand:- start:26 stop:646 length:621 start_codon:yes stop_codon:yes gene_type:complete
MRTRKEIEHRLLTEQNALVLDVLRWVIEDGSCPFCSHPQRKDLEIKLTKKEYSPAYVEKKFGWPEGTVMKHLDFHLEYTQDEEVHVETMRRESISTLDMAQEIVTRIMTWIDELEQRKINEGEITSEWVGDVTKLVGQANSSLNLIGKLKKEIGVDSQLLLAQSKMDEVMGILVESLHTEPHLLDQIELRLASLKSPTYIQPLEEE